MKEKAANVFSKTKYGLCMFVLLLVQAFMNLFYANSNVFYPVFEGVGEFNRLYYLVDYSMGKTSRMFVGSLVNLLNKSPSAEWLEGFALVILLIAIVIVSVMFGIVADKTKKEIKPQLLIFAAFFCVGSFTMFPFSRYFGYIDVHMFIAAAVAVFCSFNKYLRWFVPVLCIIGSLIHNVFALMYFPMIALILLYQLITSDKKPLKAVLLVLSVAVSLGLTLYFTTMGYDSMVMSNEEFRELITQKSPDKDIGFGLDFLSFYFYGAIPEGVDVTTEQLKEMSIFEMFTEMTKFTGTNQTQPSRLVSMLITVPLILTVFWTMWIKCIKNTDQKPGKFFYLCCILASLTIPILCIVSSDRIRMIQAGVITQFIVAASMFFVKDDAFEKTMKQFREFLSNKKLFIVLSLVLYATIIIRDSMT